MSGNIDATLVSNALRATLAYCHTKQILPVAEEGTVALFHSDRGSQYVSGIVKELLTKNHLQQSMSRKGNCWDNACAESFFKSFKTESDVEVSMPGGKEHVRMIVEEYIEYYNNKRLHSTLNYVTPTEFEDTLF